jgi:hypothetical protein
VVLRVADFSSEAKIVYTYTDEAPALATHALLPIIRRFAAPANVKVELSDISVAARIIAHFPERLTPAQRVPDSLSELGDLTQDPNCNIIKLPNVSASIPQLEEAIAELQRKGYDVPNYPANPANAAEVRLFMRRRRKKRTKSEGTALGGVQQLAVLVICGFLACTPSSDAPSSGAAFARFCGSCFSPVPVAFHHHNHRRRHRRHFHSTLHRRRSRPPTPRCWAAP